MNVWAHEQIDSHIQSVCSLWIQYELNMGQSEHTKVFNLRYNSCRVTVRLRNTMVGEFISTATGQDIKMMHTQAMC